MHRSRQRKQMDDYRNFIRSEIPEHYESLAASVVPCVIADTTLVDEDEIPCGNSKFCGRPDLPDDFRWPMTVDGPCHFVGQLSLREISRFQLACDLPQDGLLSFFFHDAGGHPEGAESVVHYFSEGESLHRANLVPDNRWGQDFYNQHLFPRQFLMRQGFVIPEQCLSGDSDASEFIGAFNEKFLDATHQFFGVPPYRWYGVGDHELLACFGEWHDTLVFSIPPNHLRKLSFAKLRVRFHCT